jgi:hypothetical protein
LACSAAWKAPFEVGRRIAPIAEEGLVGRGVDAGDERGVGGGNSSTIRLTG